MTQAKRIIIGVPVYNEENGITQFLAAIDDLSNSVRTRWPEISIHLLFADDGSTDETVHRLQSAELKSVSSISILSLSRNYGPYPAISAIFDNADGDALIIMDSDLQDSPEIVPQMIEKWLEGFENIRILRGLRGEGLLHQYASRLFYKLFGALSGLDSDIGTFGLYDRKVIASVRKFPETITYIPGVISLTGFKNHSIVADRAPRAKGTSRVGPIKLVNFALMAIFSFSSIPVHLITALGLGTCVLSLISIFVLVWIRVFMPDVPITGWTSVMVVQFFLGGVILLSLGVIGQYISIIFNEVKRRPKYLIREKSDKNIS